MSAAASRLGRMKRNKGRRYEQDIATVFRAAFPTADIRRTSQADRAANSDVVATGHPMLELLWLELNDARKPMPLAKLQQAERDIRARNQDLAILSGKAERLPVVIWHRIRERSHQVTTRLWVVAELCALEWQDHELPFGCDARDAVITLDLGAFIEILRAAISSL